MATDPPKVEEAPVWQPCATCWGQRRIFHADFTAYEVCPTCLGLGDVAVKAGKR